MLKFTSVVDNDTTVHDAHTYTVAFSPSILIKWSTCPYHQTLTRTPWMAQENDPLDMTQSHIIASLFPCERNTTNVRTGLSAETCTTHHCTPTSTARVGALIWSHPGDWITPVGPGRTPTVHWPSLRREALGWLNLTSTRTRHRSQTLVWNTGGAHISLVAE